MHSCWSEETTSKFVQLYRENDNLWNIYSPEYRNQDARNASMQSIASELNIPNFTIKDVSNKIKSLWSTFYLEFAKVEKSKASGEDTSFVHKPLVPWYTDMSYIMKTATKKKKETHSNLVSKP